MNILEKIKNETGFNFTYDYDEDIEDYYDSIEEYVEGRINEQTDYCEKIDNIEDYYDLDIDDFTLKSYSDSDECAFCQILFYKKIQIFGSGSSD